MSRRYSIADMRHDLARIVHEVEGGDSVEITRRGEPVAVMLSLEEYRRLIEGREGFWEAYGTFCEGKDLPHLGIGDDVFEDVRDTSAGREVGL